MKLGFIIPKTLDEKRVALLPNHINNFQNEIFIEKNFGASLQIPDSDYTKKGCKISSRSEIFSECDGIFSFKDISTEDYNKIKKNQIIIGWFSFKNLNELFIQEHFLKKNLLMINLDNKNPTLFYKDTEILLDFIPSNFIYMNSYLAGYASALHAVLNHGILINSSFNIAILGCGNVAQGAFNALSKYSNNIRMFYRTTLSEFKNQLNIFDIIVNGIKLNNSSNHILTIDEQKKLKKNALIIDAVANMNSTIEGCKLTSISNPIYKFNDRFYYCINNSPSVLYREASNYLSYNFSKYVFSKNLKIYFDIISKI